MGEIAVVASSKGGTGKTTTVVNIGHRLAQLGYKTLLVDMDSQGGLARALGLYDRLQESEELGGIYQALIGKVPLGKVVVETGRENLSLLPGDHTTEEAARLLLGQPGLDYRLKKLLSGSGYDWVLIDTAPSLGLMQALALAAGDYLIIPAELVYTAVTGVADVLRIVEELRELIELKIKLIGVLPIRLDMRTESSGRFMKLLAQAFKKQVWLPIPTDTAVELAPEAGQTLWEFSPGCPALVGRRIGGEMIGGYERAVERLIGEAR